MLESLRVYLVTERARTAGRRLLDVVERALCGGVRAVQLREKELCTREMLALARELRTLTARHDALLLVNDRVDVALACGADGVHLPASSFRIEDARRLLGGGGRIGVSTHSVEEVERAHAAGADFAVLGPIYDTPSKQRYGPPLGLATLERATRCALPVVAIGGITAEHTAELRAAGACGVAVIRAILEAGDPERAARALLCAH